MRLQATGIALLIFLLVLPIVAVAVPLPRSDAVPGGVVTVPLTFPASETPVAHYNGRRTMVLRNQDHWVAVVGLPLTVRPGVHELRVSQKNGRTHTVTFKVRDKRYATQHITLENRRMVNPTEADLQRIAGDRRRIKAALAHWSESVNWNQRFQLPVAGRFSSPFGLRRYFNKQPRKPHSGLDIAAPRGTRVHAPAAGRVVEIGDYFFNGKTIFLDHGQGLVTMFCHLDQIDVTPGQRVSRGEAIGAVGMTGRATGPHLHWSVSLNRTMVEPLLFLPADVVSSGSRSLATGANARGEK